MISSPLLGVEKKYWDFAVEEKAPGFEVFNASSTSRREDNAFYKQRREILFTKKEENVKMFTKSVDLYFHRDRTLKFFPLRPESAEIKKRHTC